MKILSITLPMTYVYPKPCSGK